MIGGLTYVYIIDRSTDAVSPVSDVIQVFADYNEAMSYSKWLVTYFLDNPGSYVTVWNWNGGSGRWDGTAPFLPIPNSNYPAP
jgi:hypothetical protein